MMYLNGKQGFLEDFFKRTREIIQDYEKSTNNKYETTLLCNCLLGILVFPEQKLFNVISQTSLSNENYQKLKGGLRGTKKPRSVKTIICRMRNAVAHCNIKFESATTYKSDNQIKYIHFYDDKDHQNKHDLDDYEFHLKIDVADLKDILFDFCDRMLINPKPVN